MHAGSGPLVEPLANGAAQHGGEKQRPLAQRYCILIPAYEPDSGLVAVVEGILDAAKADLDFAGIFVVDDGSCGDIAAEVFETLERLSNVTLLRHPTNRGKGSALKTGFGHIEEEAPHVGYVVTADADGQHSRDDILRLARQAVATGRPNIGCRAFEGVVPWRSRIGNTLTIALFKVVSGKTVQDTQSGLRTYLREDLTALRQIQANRYEFEFHCLFLMAKRAGATLEQIPIETIYEAGNPTSHFRPILDSLRIYLVFLRYISVSAVSGTLEFIIFSLLTMVGKPTLAALIATRAITAPIYFIGMRSFAFHSKGKIPLQAAEILVLMTVHILFLWRFVDWLKVAFGAPPIPAMLVGMLIFYMLNFLIQRFIVFRR